MATWLAFANAGFAFKFAFSSLLTLLGVDEVNNNVDEVNSNFFLNRITPTEPLCTLSAWLGQFFGLATVAWNFALVTYLFCLVHTPFVAFRHMAARWRFVRAARVCIWSLSLVTCVIGQASGAVAYTPDGTCWLRDHFILLFYAPLFAYSAWAPTVLLYTGYCLTTALRSPSQEKLKNKVIFRLLAFTFVFITTW